MDNTWRVVEILQYKLHKGTGSDFHHIMRQSSVPLHGHHGIDILSFGHSLHDLDCYYLMRVFESEEHMDKVLDAFYASDEWRNGPREYILSRIETSLKTVMRLPREGIDTLRRPL